MLQTILLFFIGFYILIKGADFLVDGAMALAKRFKISGLVIGLVITGIGTSIPEFSISFFANLVGETDIGLGTIIGSNTLNILLILGVSALFFPLQFSREWVRRDFIWNIFAVFVVASFIIPFGSEDGLISRYEGFFMFILFFIWLYIAIKNTNSVHFNNQILKKNNDSLDYENKNSPDLIKEPIKVLAFPLAWGLILAGLVGVVVGGEWVVDGAVVIAREFNLSDAFIGLTILGVGTSLPELAVTFVAAYRGQPGLALGNIIGSNIFDFLMTLGFGAMVQPILFPRVLFPDILLTMFSAVFLYGSMFVGELYRLKRWQGLTFMIIYVFYIVYIIGRG